MDTIGIFFVLLVTTLVLIPAVLFVALKRMSSTAKGLVEPTRAGHACVTDAPAIWDDIGSGAGTVAAGDGGFAFFGCSSTEDAPVVSPRGVPMPDGVNGLALNGHTFIQDGPGF